MTKYTVIGFYDGGQRYMEHVEADSPCGAITAALEKLEDGVSDLTFVDVIEGHHSGLLDGNNVWDAVDCVWIEDDSETGEQSRG